MKSGTAAHNLGKTIVMQLKLKGSFSARSFAVSKIEAEKLLKRALHIRERHFGESHLSVLDTCHELAHLHKTIASSSAVVTESSHHARLAEALFRRSLSGREAELPPDHSALLVSLNDLAIFLQQHGNLEKHSTESICLLESAVERATAKRRGGNNEDSLIYFFNLADALVRTDQFEKAAVVSRRAWDMIKNGDKEIFPEYSPVEWRLRIQRQCQDQLGQILHAQGKHDDAMAVEEESVSA